MLALDVDAIGKHASELSPKFAKLFRDRSRVTHRLAFDSFFCKIPMAQAAIHDSYDTILILDFGSQVSSAS